MASTFGAGLAHAVSEACAFAATVPMPGTAPVFRFVRAALAVVLVPVLLSSNAPAGMTAMESALRGATIGASLGLSATIAFSVAATAGALADAALQWNPLPNREIDAGPVGFLYQLGFAAVLFASGGFAELIFAVARADTASPDALFSLNGVAALVSMSTRDALGLAAPALFAQALATLIAGMVARAAPQIGSLLLASPLVSAAVGAVLLAGGAVLLDRFAWVASDALRHLGLR